MRSTRAYVPAAIMLAGCIFVLRARSQDAVALAAPLAGVLPALGGYSVHDQQLGAEERRVAGMTEYVARLYVRDSTPVFSTFVSYYDRQTKGRTIHSPRNCLPGAGWEIMSAGTTTMTVDGATYEVNRSLLKNGASTAVVYYWYQGRGRIVANEYAVKWNLLRDAAISGHTEEALVRVVVPIPPGAAADSVSAIRLADARALGVDISAKLAHDVARVLPSS